jgi:hypothetical protein
MEAGGKAEQTKGTAEQEGWGRGVYSGEGGWVCRNGRDGKMGNGEVEIKIWTKSHGRVI